MKKHWKIILLILIAYCVLVIVEISKPEPINWKETYSRYHKSPFGNYAFFNVLENLFLGKAVSTSHLPIYNTLSDSTSTNLNYILINKEFAPSDYDQEALFEFVSRGNNAFIAAGFFGGRIAEEFKLEVEPGFTLTKDTASLNFTNKSLQTASGYSYTFRPAQSFFTSFDTAQSVVLGTGKQKKVNFLEVKYGAGSFYMSAVPIVFTNYFLLHDNNHEYIEKAISYLPVNDVIWDEYYKVGKMEAQTPLRFILTEEPLRWAYIITVLFILAYIVFEGKRKQRIVPVITPVKNTTLEFVGIVSQLNYHQKDYKHLGEKKIAFFQDYLRTRYRLSNAKHNREFLQRVSNKTSVPFEHVVKTFSIIDHVLKSMAISEKELHELSDCIETFYSKNT